MSAFVRSLIRLSTLAPLLLAGVGCTSLSIGTDPDQDAGLEFRGLLNGHANVNGLSAYDGTLLQAGILGGAGGDDLATLEIWPIGGVGVGLAGARVRVLPFELGLGTLFYDPEPFRSPDTDEGEEELEEEIEAVETTDDSGY